MIAIGNGWSRRLFDGNFYRSPAASPDLPAVSLVFVQSRDGNTASPNPSTLGGGDSDKHLIYEGLSRVDADAVLAGAGTTRGERMVFSVWHPELVPLRLALGHARHPAQVLVTAGEDLPIERGLMFEEPTLRVFVITLSGAVSSLRSRLRGRPWVEVIDGGSPISMTHALRQLHDRAIRVISAVGGRRTATTLFREGLVRDLYLTTSPIEGGEPKTPYYEGPPLALTRVLLKCGREEDAGVRFEHFTVG